MAKLTLAFRDKKLKIFPLTDAETVIGREPDCTIHIDSLAIEPMHARIRCDGNNYLLSGLHADFKIQVNQHQIEKEYRLNEGDLIQIGKHTLSFSGLGSRGQFVANKAQPGELRVALLQIANGSHRGRIIQLSSAMTRLGKKGRHSAIITRRDDGYYLAHLEGNSTPKVNDVTIGESSRKLNDGDCIGIGRLNLNFFLDGTRGNTAMDNIDNDRNGNEQRHFTRIPFDASVILIQGDNRWNSTLIDLSLKGALIKRPDNWYSDSGSEYQLHLKLDSETEIDMDVTVAHIDDGQIGFYCKDIDLDSITHLRRLVELNLGNPALLERELSALG